MTSPARYPPLAAVHAAGAAATVLMFLGFGYFVALPILRSHSRQSDVLEQIQTHEAERQRHITARRDAEARILTAQRELEAQAIRLEPSASINKRLDTIIRLAGSSGLDVTRLMAGEAIRSANHASLPLILSSHGPYAACENFIARLFSELKDTEITSLTLSSAPENPATPVGLELELLWFVAPEDASND